LDDLGRKEVYTYDSNGNITIAHFYGDATTQTNPNGTGSVTFVNGEVSEIVNASGATLTYTYDNKEQSAQEHHRIRQNFVLRNGSFGHHAQHHDAG